MNGREALTELLDRLVANGGETTFIADAELRTWPPAAVAAMKAQKLIVAAADRANTTCPGCERACTMPVQVLTQDDLTDAFVVCDKRADINRVSIPIDALRRWRASGTALAAYIAGALDRRPADVTSKAAGRWEIGSIRGEKRSALAVLTAEGEFRLHLAGHSIALADVLQVSKQTLSLQHQRLKNLIDNPVAGGGDIESAGAKRERVRALIADEQAKGNRAFQKTVAMKLGISPNRVKQLRASSSPRDDDSNRSGRQTRQRRR